jgi:hypothetical protein
MRMRLTWLSLSLAAAALAWSGCSKKAGDTTGLEKTFQGAAAATPGALQGADATTRKMVNDAVQAIKNNDPAEGVVILQGVRSQPNLSAEQLTAVQDMIAQAQKPIIDRADRGDPAAVAALQRIRQSKRRQ